jgi:YfiH family protein
LTADCLPIILHDTRNNVIAAIHAGWRSSVQKIVTCALRSMHETYGTQAANIRAFFGPCACTCCYSVGPEMMHHVAPHQDQTIRVSGTTYYFDLARYNQILLCNEGAPPESCCFDYNQCTICNPIFCSYRRQRDRAGRQMSVVALR